MKTLLKLVVLLVSTFLNVTAGADTNCGNLEERLLFTGEPITEPAEFPWFGLLFKRRGDNFLNAQCNVVIVNDGHVLTPASCVRDFADRPEWISVRLGIWNETHTPDDDYICNDHGFCVPGPVQHLVSEIKVHPHADKDTGDNDLAILQLTKRIKTSPYIQPLCLQPISEPASWTNSYFHYGGFDDSVYTKSKGEAFIVTRRFCFELADASKPPPENQFCGFPLRTTTFYNGAALMGLNVVKDVPQSFYLIGLLIDVVDSGQTTVFIFQDLKPLRSWIVENTRLPSL